MNTYKTPVSDERLVLAFYGVQPSAKASEGFFLITTQWFTELGYPPDTLGVSGKGHSGKMGNYRRGKSKLDRGGFAGVTSFSLVSSKPNALIPANEFYASADYSHAADDGGYAVVAVPDSLVDKEAWLRVVEGIIRSVRPAYGIGFKRELALGPVWYALGVCYGGDPVPTGEAYEEGRNISRWCDTGMAEQVYRQGLLRDVYPWNFLTQPQLDRSIARTSLEQWIRQDRGRGSLSPLVEGVVLWEVQETRIPELRRSLHEAGAIFDWRKYP